MLEEESDYSFKALVVLIKKVLHIFAPFCRAQAGSSIVKYDDYSDRLDLAGLSENAIWRVLSFHRAPFENLIERNDTANRITGWLSVNAIETFCTACK